MTKLDSCDIIRDLLPGYIDGVLSKTGTNAVKEHLEKCGECNRVYREMTEEMESMLKSVLYMALFFLGFFSFSICKVKPDLYQNMIQTLFL